MVPGGWIGQGWAGSGPITGVKQAWGQDICQDSQHCLTRGACVQAHLYNSHVGFSLGDPEVLQVWHRGRGGSCSRQLRGDDIALGSPIAKVTSQLGHLLIDLSQVTYLRASVSFLMYRGCCEGSTGDETQRLRGEPVPGLVCSK